MTSAVGSCPEAVGWKTPSETGALSGATEGTMPFELQLMAAGPAGEVLTPGTPVRLAHLEIVGHSLPNAQYFLLTLGF